MKIKKILSIVLATVIVVSSVSAYAFYDVQEGDIKTAVDRLVSLGIISGYPNNTFMPSNPITRAEFAKVIVAMQDYPLIKEEELFFSDSEKNWAKEYIASAKFFNIVNGKPGNIFAPDDNVTYNEVIKMVVAALGYENEAQTLGGYPGGYIAQANKLGILTGVAYQGLENATRGNVAIIVNNALNASDYAVPEEILTHPDFQNEKIKIDKSEKMYALGRILMYGQLRGRLGISDYEADFAMFEYPEDVTTVAQKIDYLSKASYILTEDITVNYDINAKYNKENNYASGSFAGIGAENFAVGFRGFFNGNNKTITVKSSGIVLEQSNEYVTYNIGLFNQLIGAEVFDLNIKTEEDILVTSNRNNYNFGLLAGKVVNSTIYNVNVSINNGAKVGVVQNELTARNDNIGGIAGAVQGYNEIVEGSLIKSCTVNLNDGSKLIAEKASGSEGRMYLGGIAGYLCGTGTERNIIENCQVNINNSDIEGAACKEDCVVGGITGFSVFSDFLKNTVNMVNGAIGAKAENTGITVYSDNQQDYYNLSVGGILGFSSSGSDNKTNLGRQGNRIIGCSVISKGNSGKKEVLYAKEKAGQATNAGGILGMSFNNCLVDKCVVDIENGVIIAERTESYDEQPAQYGSVAGGIVGRLEHTSVISNSVVNGKNLDIIVRSTEKDMYAGGIVGIDIGPCHHKLVSLKNNIFSGNESSKIELEIVKSNAQNYGIYVGGIAGQTGYRTENCIISGTTVELSGKDIENASRVYMGSLIGVREDTSWELHKTFEPDEYGIFDSVYKDVSIKNNLEKKVNVTVDAFKSK